MRKNGILALFLALGLFSCKEDVPEPAAIKGLEYFPLTIGRFVEYEADSTVYTEVPKDTLNFKYRIKEKLVEEFIDNQGLKAYRLERYIKWFNPLVPYDSMNWQIKEAWLVKANNARVQVQENNNLYTKLIFPTLENASWDGNAYNSLGKSTYAYEYIDRAENINGLSLNRVLKVKQKTDTSNLIINQLEYEQFGADIGLVFRQYTNIESNNIVPNVPVKNRIEKGVTYTLRIIKYGTE
ncbi:MAG: hypothetical protein JNK73_10905 [Bacteroidia bacterium]|nr:hypothetical protein [Bacteroidia bacterium]